MAAAINLISESAFSGASLSLSGGNNYLVDSLGSFENRLDPGADFSWTNKGSVQGAGLDFLIVNLTASDLSTDNLSNTVAGLHSMNVHLGGSPALVFALSKTDALSSAAQTFRGSANGDFMSSVPTWVVDTAADLNGISAADIATLLANGVSSVVVQGSNSTPW